MKSEYFRNIEKEDIKYSIPLSKIQINELGLNHVFKQNLFD
jgi:hypothetical protein